MVIAPNDSNPRKETTMEIFDPDAVALWIKVFFAVAVVTGVLTTAALVSVFVSARSSGARAVRRNAPRRPAIPNAFPGSAATGGAA